MDDSIYTQYQSTCMISESSSTCVAIQKTISDTFIASGVNIYNIFTKCYHPVYPAHF